MNTRSPEPGSDRADMIVDEAVLLELKSVESVQRVHKAQMLIYLDLSGCTVGLLMNFNSVLLKDGLHRFIARASVRHEDRDRLALHPADQTPR